jgi:hypothetical protein
MTPEQEQDAHALEQQILQHIASSLQDKQKALDKKNSLARRQTSRLARIAGQTPACHLAGWHGSARQASALGHPYSQTLAP